MALSPGDPHSYARPELARVNDIVLLLYVDFDRKVLLGRATLIIERISPINEVILDSYGFDILNVRNSSTGSYLKYHIGQCGIFGSKFTIQLPQIVEDCKDDHNKKLCSIMIDYKTSPNSPALYWLKPEQTVDGTHPFLISNNQYTYARSVFPCQDTPSAKFTYTVTILAPTDFSVLMPASLTRTSTVEDRSLYTFSQTKPIPSYSLIIVVGVLQYFSVPSSNVGVWAENKNIHVREKIQFLSENSEKMLRKAEILCGAYPWAPINICVLPPSVSHFEIECPSLIFVSPTLIGGNLCVLLSIARTISQNWTGISVTSANYKHLWLNKSFSTIIYSRILRCIFDENTNNFIRTTDLDVTRRMLLKFGTTGMLKCLLPNLVGLLPSEGIKYVPYEKGYELLLELQNKMGGPLAFNTFFKSYLAKFAHKSIRTEEWVEYFGVYLHTNLPNILRELNTFDWNSWFNNPNYLPPSVYKRPIHTIERMCISLAEGWISWNDDIDNNNLPFQTRDMQNYCDLQKIYFLNYLRASRTILSIKKLYFMSIIYQFNNQIDEIRFAWLRLCIKNRWVVKVPAALQFAIKFCSRKFTYPIFRDLYEWTDVRGIVITEYLRESWQMMDDVRQGVGLILHMKENVSWNNRKH